MAAAEEDEPILSGPEEEEEAGDEEAAKRHRQLVDTLSTLSGGKRLRATERTEASRQISEFDVGGGADEKVVLSELLKPASASPALRRLRKQLNKAQQKKAVKLPLSKEENERVVREAAYTQTAQDLAKWDPVVRQNRRAEQLVFPLQQESVTVAPVEEVISSWQARTPLEQEIFSLLHKTQQPIKDPLLTPYEKASLQAMSLEEAQLRRMELQRARALQSYYEAKARRKGKIKSKKYHKVLRKGKSRKVLQEFEMLQKSNPEAALEQLEKIEKARIEERMSLKHQNKGRWAKSTVLMAKYNLEARQAMQEQLARNKELTEKVLLESDNEDGGNNSDAEGGLIPDVVNDGHIGMNPDNPWMLGKTCANPKEDIPAQANDSEESDGEEVPLQSLMESEQGQQGSSELQGPGEEETIPMLPDVLPPAPPSPAPEEPFLKETLDRLHTLEDVEALEPEIASQEDRTSSSKEAVLLEPAEAKSSLQAKGAPDLSQATSKAGKKKPAKRKALIDLKAVLAEAPQAVKCPLVPSVVQDEFDADTDQRRVIQEAFANDNVMADFMKEKRRAEEASKPKAVDLVLPGWGEWGGTGLRPSSKKKKWFFIKPAPQTQRKDKHLPHVILSEQRNILAAGYQVNQLPFPFENSQQFERSIQAPVGPTWNTQRAFQRLTAPRVVTQPGHIIRPITAEDANLPSQKDKTDGARKKPDLRLATSPRKGRPHYSAKKKKR
uniref:UTP14C small subunit processome component n=1 Tax=Anolis carolinensis TaxID=28377 RepID=H9GET4_ANOCA|nr:PREDICTED: U3 small nucleolar RNA-associated protein 14 homolog A [Anolis carolinensis]|eukprot:XP_003227139.1 PREDICTED: U3 small nucleolar RNA-associated protein 14 homolog A [Anolis carolinensis]